ncbi:MAG: TetR/AcrR family transcriptional regulator [Actinomycetota bacterium]|nr:TetR/AcrR family transcriptional regulator [Actinomycetota bacterium]
MPGRREQRRQSVRARLEQAGLSLFNRQGYERTTVRDIASAAGLSPRTFFRHFGSKENVVFAAAEPELARLVEHVNRQPAGGVRGEVARRAVLDFAADMEANRELILTQVRLILETPSLRRRGLEHQARWVDEVGRGLARRGGRSEPAIEDRALAAAVIGALNAATVSWTMSGGRSSLPDAVNEAFDALRRDLAEARVPASGR